MALTIAGAIDYAKNFAVFDDYAWVHDNNAIGTTTTRHAENGRRAGAIFAVFVNRTLLRPHREEDRQVKRKS
jgi:hypothetical protein